MCTTQPHVYAPLKLPVPNNLLFWGYFLSIYDKSGSLLTTLCTIRSCSVSSLDFGFCGGIDVAAEVLKVTDFGMDFGIGALVGFETLAVLLSKKEKSADAHGSTLTAVVG